MMWCSGLLISEKIRTEGRGYFVHLSVSSVDIDRHLFLLNATNGEWKTDVIYMALRNNNVQMKDHHIFRYIWLQI